ncbi:MAG: 50S ribosomal protein L10 [Coriobacteriales bacterium]|jgi:large subunit ribosomal protein L10|nr:50S ribosomal protein L10 [Coriobacteriales bacterium]
MPSQEKLDVVSKIKEDIQGADNVWIVDYRGLTVQQSEELRRNIRAQGAAYKIYKNSLTECALRELDMPDLGDMLEGPSAFVFATGDPVGSAKALKDFGKDHEALTLKGGLMGGKVVAMETIHSIADLPSREELLAKLLGTISRPMQGIVSVLNAVPEKFVRTLDAVAQAAA